MSYSGLICGATAISPIMFGWRARKGQVYNAMSVSDTSLACQIW